MDKLRETIVHGTQDFPFARYRLSTSKVGTHMCGVHWHPEQEIIFVKEGTVELLYDRQSLQLSSGDIAFVPPGEVHYVQSVTSPSAYTAFVFSLSLITLPESNFFQKQILQPLETGKLRFPPVIRSSDPLQQKIAQNLIPLIECDLASDTSKFTALRGILDICGILSSSMLQTNQDETGKGTYIIKTCLHYMETNYAKKLTLQEIAQQVHLHPNYLCSLFREYTGQTVFQQLSRIRVEKAAKLLRTQNISVAQAGLLCGFDSTGFFTKKFKILTGFTPTEYKQHHP